MKSIARLKDRARKLEQQEQWTAAIEAYKTVLEREEAGDEFEIDLGLANRVGDLHLRIGEADEAVSYYVSAAEKYADAGFYNNAIALCNKALRHRPNRIDLYLKLSDLCARQGFHTDARRWILEYADRQMRSGRLEPALTALADFADMSDDPEVRETLADHLAGHEHPEDALNQLQLAYQRRVQRGEMEAAESVAEKARTIDPSVELTDGRFEELSAPGEGDGQVDWEHPIGGGLEPEVDHGLEAPVSQPDGEDAPVEGLVGFETTALEDELSVEAGALEGLEPSPSDTGAADAVQDGIEPLPLLEDPDPEEEEAEPLPLLDSGYTGDEHETGEESSQDRDRGGDRDNHEILRQSQDLVSRGLMQEALKELSLVPPDADRADIEQAVQVVTEIIHQDPNDLAALEQRVNYAARLDDPSAEVSALRELADVHARLGDEARARDLYARILDLDPDQSEIRTALEALRSGEAAREVESTEAPEGPEAASEVPEGELSEPEGSQEPGDPGQVGEAAPAPASPDHEFSAMLTEFRAKVTDEPEHDDVGDHYDLGLAFKEMGLLDEAIAEFKTELDRVEAPRDRLRIYEELGQCHIQKGHYTVAVTVLERALEVADVEDAELLGIYYHLGHCYGELGQPNDAREAYGKILAIDATFADVPDRMAQL